MKIKMPDIEITTQKREAKKLANKRLEKIYKKIDKLEPGSDEYERLRIEADNLENKLMTNKSKMRLHITPENAKTATEIITAIGGFVVTIVSVIRKK